MTYTPLQAYMLNAGCELDIACTLLSSNFSDNSIFLPLVVIKYDSSRWNIAGVSDLNTTILVIDTSSFLYVKSIYNF